MTNAHSFQIKWPVDKTEIVIRVEYKVWDFLFKYRPNEFLKLFTVEEVLKNPNRIFSGLNRQYSDTSQHLCVVGKPQSWRRYNRNNEIEIVPFPPNLVFLVFLNKRKSVSEFRAEEADREDQLSPENWENRYGEILWKKANSQNN
ncbi:MAG: hypothetical protein GY928_18190 [Colwellia sp.]|nr:hypothetical protein [Colwellia sp.]